MSEGQSAKTTRRSFLGTATVATAATLAAPVGGAAHNAGSRQFRRTDQGGGGEQRQRKSYGGGESW